MTDRRWRHPWQVVRFGHGVTVVCCSHRWEVTAGWCADRRDFWNVFRPSGGWFDERRNPRFKEGLRG